MAAIFGEGKISLKIANRHSLDTLWVENLVEIARLRRYTRFCFFSVKKNRDI